MIFGYGRGGEAPRHPTSTGLASLLKLDIMTVTGYIYR
jgi:hypothetical protein